MLGKANGGQPAFDGTLRAAGLQRGGGHAGCVNHKVGAAGLLP